MNSKSKTVVFLEEVVDFQEVNYWAREDLKFELRKLIDEDYGGDFNRFMNNEVFTEDYGTTRDFIQLMYDELQMEY